MITDPIYIFSRSLDSFQELKKKEPSLRGIWYDGKSELIRDLFNYVNPDRLYVEKGLKESLERHCARWQEKEKTFIRVE